MIVIIVVNVDVLKIIKKMSKKLKRFIIKHF
nr:MAG TPA: hypothetical protein [Caudoviricetes sp.]